jgi:hypothetical protein
MERMLDILYVCCGCLDFCFIHAVLCIFTRVFVFCFAFSYFHRVHLCSPPSSGFSAHLRALIDPLTVGRPCGGFRLLVGMRSTLLQAFALHSRTRYSFIPYPSDYTFVRWRVWLSNHLDSGVDFYFVDLVRNFFRVNFPSFWSVFVCIS